MTLAVQLNPREFRADAVMSMGLWVNALVLWPEDVGYVLQH